MGGGAAGGGRAFVVGGGELAYAGFLAEVVVVEGPPAVGVPLRRTDTRVFFWVIHRREFAAMRDESLLDFRQTLDFNVRFQA